MPASGGDPVGTALRVSLATCNNTHDDIDSKIVASSTRILLTHIEYEPCDGYKHSVLENLKSKYIVLKPSYATENRGVVNLKSAATDMKQSTVETECPAPKVTLFPSEAVQLGWRGMRQIGAGMINMGNTCYLNSTLQALFHVPALVNWLESDSDHLDKCTMNGNMECTICAMAKTLKTSHIKSGGVMKPFLINSKLKMICKHMTHGTQEDAHEFMRYLIESMEKAYLNRYKNKVLDNYSKETTPLNQIFGGYMRTEVECLQCHAVSTTFQHFQDLLLDVRRCSTLDDALAGYFCKERLDGEDAYRCERCLRKVSATKKFCIQKPPLVLCLQLKRFSIMGGKINKHVSFSQHLDLTRFLCPQSASKGQPLTYRLVAMVNHMGASINCGHYTAIAQTSSGQFYHFDDSSVRPISLAAALEANAYIIIYEMERSPHRSTAPGNSKPATATAPAPFPLGAHSNGHKFPVRPLVPPVRPTNTKPSADIVPVHSRSQPLLSLPTNSIPRVSTGKSETTNILPPLANRGQVAFELQPRHIRNGKVCRPAQPPSRPSSLVPYDSDDSSSSEAAAPRPDMPNLDCGPPGPGHAPNSLPHPPQLAKARNLPRKDKSSIEEVKCGGSSWQVTDASLHSPSIHSEGSSNSVASSAAGWTVCDAGKPPEAVVMSATQFLAGKHFSNDISKRQLPRAPAKVDVATAPKNGSQINLVLDLDSSTKDGGKDKKVKKKKKHKEHLNGNAMSSETSGDDSYEWVEKTNMATIENGEQKNGLIWNGIYKSNTADFLAKVSHRGYGTSVSSWSGGRTHMEREVADDRRDDRKRSNEYRYDQDLDRGRVKKMKYHQNNKEMELKQQHTGNVFQDYQYKKQQWVGKSSYYGTYHSDKFQHHKYRGHHSYHFQHQYKYSNNHKFQKNHARHHWRQ